MSDFLMIGGTRVPIAAPSGADEEYQELGGEVVRSFSGRLLSTVKGRARVWRLQTPPLPESEAQMLAVVLAHGSPLLCSGALIGADAVSCYVRGVRTRPVAPLSRLRRVVEFELHEAAPAMSPILFRLHAGRPLPPGASFTRPSPATYFDRTGILREAGPNVLRTEWLDLDGDGRRETPALKLERASTNHIRNPRCEGAIVGVVGSGGALPTFWPLDTTSGLTVSVEAVGTDAGLPYIDLRIQGTPTGGLVLQYFEGATQIAAAPDEVWTGSVYARLVGGSLSGVTDVFLRIAEYQSGGGILRSSQQTIDLANGRHSHTATMGADTGQVRHGLALSVTPGQAVDVTLRIGGPQLEQSPVTSSLILPPVGAPAVSSRALDVLTAPWSHGLISFTAYTRFVETGGVQLTSATVALWFGAGGGLIWVRSSAESPTYWITLRDSRGASAQVQTTPGVMTQVGQLVELMPQVEVSSQGVRARLIQAVDGGDPVTSSWTGYVRADWVPTTLRLVSRASGGNQGQMNLRDLVVLRGSGWTMDAARRLVG